MSRLPCVDHGWSTSVIGSAFFIAASPHRRIAASPHRRIAASPHRRIAAPPPPPPRPPPPAVPAASEAAVREAAPSCRHRHRHWHHRRGLPRAFEALLGLPENLLRPVPDTANRSLILTETEMLRNLDVEFRGNGFRGELYSRLVRGGPDRRARRPRVR
ncbi:hypothetical protein [Streptomyces tricolor]